MMPMKSQFGVHPSIIRRRLWSSESEFLFMNDNVNTHRAAEVSEVLAREDSQRMGWGVCVYSETSI